MLTRGCDKWPLYLEAQVFLVANTPQLKGILIWVRPYLDSDDSSRLKCIAAPTIDWGWSLGRSGLTDQSPRLDDADGD